MKPDRLSEFFGDIKVGELIDKCDSNGKLSLQVIDKSGIKTEITVTRETKTRSSAPGFLDTIIIILVSAAAVLFLLWATSRTMGINAFESLPGWLEQSYHAVWSAAATGATGIGLAIVQMFTRKAEDPRPNYLLYIMLTTTVMLGFIFILPRAFSRPDDHKTYVEAHLTSGGFTPSWLGGAPQMPGTECGQPTVYFSTSEVDTKVGEWNSVNWDASYICRRQGIGGLEGTINWDTPNHDVSSIPTSPPAYGEWGTARFKYLQPGNYAVTLGVATHCLDANRPPNPCTSRGHFDVRVTR